MQFDSLDQISALAEMVNFSIIELPKEIDQTTILPNSYHVRKADDKTVITVEQIRDVTKLASLQSDKASFFVIEKAETMGESAANAFLKALEEPKPNVHFVLLTNDIYLLMPTVRSRANIFRMKTQAKISDPPKYDDKIIAIAKEYISAKPNQLPDIADKITKLDKNNARLSALTVISCSIDLMYKSYLMTGNRQFMTKLQNLLAAEKDINMNGHIKLQLIAHMI